MTYPSAMVSLFNANLPLELICATTEQSSRHTRSPRVTRSGSVINPGLPPAQMAQSLPILAPSAR